MVAVADLTMPKQPPKHAFVDQQEIQLGLIQPEPVEWQLHVGIPRPKASRGPLQDDAARILYSVCKAIQDLVCCPRLALAGRKGCVDYETHDLADCCGVEQAGPPRLRLVKQKPYRGDS